MSKRNCSKSWFSFTNFWKGIFSFKFNSNKFQRLTEGKESSESTLKELEKSLLTKITELDEKQSQITDALESIAGLIKEQSKKETRNQEVQTEKGFKISKGFFLILKIVLVITVTVDTKNRKRKSSDHNRTFHHTCSEKKQWVLFFWKY